MLLLAPFNRLIELRSFIETANPPESSLGRLIRCPLESRFMLS
jgi:hypothetical protein